MINGARSNWKTIFNASFRKTVRQLFYRAIELFGNNDHVMIVC